MAFACELSHAVHSHQIIFVASSLPAMDFYEKKQRLTREAILRQIWRNAFVQTETSVPHNNPFTFVPTFSSCLLCSKSKYDETREKGDPLEVVYPPYGIDEFKQMIKIIQSKNIYWHSRRIGRI